ncbi:hypothetical protein N7495_001774 [Penicillium taxi]|uniref:uncharacterized protein n=1 Tax=Penicillium taxi TaxID=168475 RepID=UPI002544EF54|nr:uncharacterized protein N7495_001774 [Penicillium taxi]KAJ5909092.1 hypothetical protein N7495_001774 [Penicillium taxi]
MSSDDEDIRRPGRRTSLGLESDAGNESAVDKSPSADLGQMDVDDDDDDDRDLFGSDGDEGLDDMAPQSYALEDHLSDDDSHSLLDRMDVEPAGEVQVYNVRDLDYSRSPAPATSTGEVYGMRVPDFLTVQKEEFRPETYSQSYSVASTSICWRRDPNNKDLLQSNARFIQWEDGSITLQLASAPKEQYHISSKSLQPLTKSGQYDSKLDSHVYLSSASETAGMLRVASRVTHGLTVQPTINEADDAIKQLQESLARANASKKSVAEVGTQFDRVDPELAAREAENAEKEAAKQERRRQLVLERERDRSRERARRATYRKASGSGGLDSGDLTTRPRKPRVTNRRGEINTDDEAEYDSRRRNREDEYDEDDGFLVNSDEEIEQEEDEEEEELDDDVDAEGEVDDEIAPVKAASSNTPVARSKRRRVVDDDDEDEL